MLKKFLKRFERLEHRVKDDPGKGILFSSKRFEFLEIGEKRIEVAITDKISREEQAPADISYYFLCPYCGSQNEPEIENCSYCKHLLKTKLGNDFQIKAKLVKKCDSCAAVNQQSRKNCWVCGKEFPDAKNLPKDDFPESENVITLDIDGKVYNSNDKDLPVEVYLLIQRIRKKGYSRQLIDEWINNRNRNQEQDNLLRTNRLSEIRFSLTWQGAVLAAFILLILFQLRACFFYAHQ